MKVWGGGDKVMETGSSMGIWEGVRMVVVYGGVGGRGFSENIRFEVDWGNKVQFWAFWHDHWCGEEPLKVVFPML